MKERPILFNGEMVRAIYEGRKTQTRRPFKNPFGEPGDRLWVRHTWWHNPSLPINPMNEQSWDEFSNGVNFIGGERINDCHPLLEEQRWRKRPSIHMPRWASRINLEVIRVWRETIQDISTEDIIAEGKSTTLREYDACCDLEEQMAESWDKIYASRGLGWEDNPAVSCCEFKLLSVAK